MCEKNKEDDHMRTASEVVQHLNETRCNCVSFEIGVPSIINE